MKNRKEDEDVYMRLDYLNSLESKRDLLEITASVINMQMIGEKIKKFGRDEVSDRKKLKNEIKIMVSSLKKVVGDMPQVKISKFEEKEPHIEKEKSPEPTQKAPKRLVKKVEKSALSNELEEVRKKIEALKK